MGTVFIGTHEIKPNSFGYFHEKVSGHFAHLTSFRVRVSGNRVMSFCHRLPNT